MSLSENFRRFGTSAMQWHHRWKRRFAMLAILLSAANLPGNAVAQGTLETVRKDVRVADERTVSAETEPAPPSKRDKSKSSNGGGWPLEVVGLAVFAAGCAVAAPIWGPRYLLDDYGELGFYPRFPYEEGLPGYLMIEPEIPLEPFPWSTRVRGEYGESFDDTSFVAGHLLLETTSRFGGDLDVNYRWETTGAGARDTLWTGDMNLLYRFAQSEHWQFRAGGGVNWIADPVGDDWGYNFTYSCDWFPHAPWVLSAELDWGEVGHAHLVHVRATIGCQFHGAEIYAGYDYFDLGPIPLGGMVGGVQFWF
jgi:hypothetical protein